jgi:hypothetical protein
MVSTSSLYFTVSALYCSIRSDRSRRWFACPTMLTSSRNEPSGRPAPLTRADGSLVAGSVATCFTLTFGYFLLNDAMTVSKTLYRSPCRFQIVTSPRADSPVRDGVLSLPASFDAGVQAVRPPATAAAPRPARRSDRRLRPGWVMGFWLMGTAGHSLEILAAAPLRTTVGGLLGQETDPGRKNLPDRIL